MGIQDRLKTNRMQFDFCEMVSKRYFQDPTFSSDLSYWHKTRVNKHK